MNSRQWKAGPLCIVAAVSMGMQVGAVAAEPDYPTRPVRVIVAMPPGGGLDATARYVAKELSEKLKQPFIVENRPGANGFIAAKTVAAAQPDGYTLWMSSNSPMVTNAAVFRSLAYDPVHDFTPIARLVRLPLVIAVPASSPYTTLESLMAAGRASPGKLNYGSGSATYQLVLELIHERNRVKANAVPYKGTVPAMTDLAAGNVDYSVGEINAVMPLARGGKVRVLAVTSGQRLKELPDVPTVAESGAPGLEIDGWIALYGPAKMPPKLVAALSETVDGIMRRPSTAASIGAMSGVVYPAGPEVLKAFQASETERAKRIVQSANIPRE